MLLEVPLGLVELKLQAAQFTDIAIFVFDASIKKRESSTIPTLCMSDRVLDRTILSNIVMFT